MTTRPYDMLGIDAIAGYPPPATGWTTPTIIYDRMRQIDAHAKALDEVIERNVRRAEFLNAWREWIGKWRAFFEKYQGTWAKLGAVTYSDELASQTESWRQQLDQFDTAYKAEGVGPSVPGQPTSPPVPPPPPPSHEGLVALRVPWWAWTIGGIAVVGVGYTLYKSFTKFKRQSEAQENAIRNALPSFLSTQGVPSGLAQASAAHDPPPFMTTPEGVTYRRLG